jgi:4-methylaminobutanoate oxidase (formaldehyde-forming)
MYGHFVDASLGMGYVADPSGITSREWVLGGTYEIEVAAERVAARVSLEPFYDPKSLRVKA